MAASQEPSIKNGDSRSPRKQTDEEAPGPFSRGERFDQQIKILYSNSSELLDLKAQPLAKPLTEEKWKDLSASYLQSRGRSYLCVLPP